MHFLTGSSLLLTLSVVATGVYGAALNHVHRHPSRACYEDNTLRALERYPTDAAVFCPKYLKSSSEKVPNNLAGVPVAKLSSACTCFEKTAALANPVSTPSTTPTSTPVVVSPPTSLSTIKTILPSSTAVTSPLTTSAALPPTSTTSVKPSPTSSSSATGPTTLSTSGKSYIGGKRGLVYDWTSKDYSKYFKDSKKIGFGSDWGIKRSPAPGVTFEIAPYVPTIAISGGTKDDDTWLSTVKTLISSGTPMLFASNEPDNSGQANLTPEKAASVYNTFIQPFAGQVPIASPAITNGGSPAGLTWLDKFASQCTNCHFDIINVHHYVPRANFNVDQAVAALQSYITKDVAAFQAKHPQFQNTKICLGEFWLWNASDDEGADYLKKLLPWLDGNSNIACYQAFGGLWPGNFINSAGTGLSKSGQVYHDL